MIQSMIAKNSTDPELPKVSKKKKRKREKGERGWGEEKRREKIRRGDRIRLIT